jgi:hypothetical protein
MTEEERLEDVAAGFSLVQLRHGTTLKKISNDSPLKIRGAKRSYEGYGTNPL